MGSESGQALVGDFLKIHELSGLGWNTGKDTTLELGLVDVSTEKTLSSRASEGSGVFAGAGQEPRSLAAHGMTLVSGNDREQGGVTASDSK